MTAARRRSRVSNMKSFWALLAPPLVLAITAFAVPWLASEMRPLFFCSAHDPRTARSLVVMEILPFLWRNLLVSSRIFSTGPKAATQVAQNKGMVLFMLWFRENNGAPNARVGGSHAQCDR